jgi:hypothetical protein
MDHVGDKIQSPVKARIERPRARRYPFVASVELVDLESEVQFQGRVTDLSLYGCGVTASKPLCLRLALRRSRTRNSVKHFLQKTQFLAGNYNKRLMFKYLVSMDPKPAICKSNV